MSETITRSEEVQVVFISQRELDLLALAKARIAENDCENHCAHRKEARRAEGGRPDPTTCPHYGLHPYMWCDGFELDLGGTR